jgi:hypothetical protein
VERYVKPRPGWCSHRDARRDGVSRPGVS